VGQIYLRANPLLKEPLRLEHVKPRLLGQRIVDDRLRARQYTREHGDDMPEVKDWVWPY
jgi:phosphoketolase